jgi:hypothetical protein
MSRKWRRFEVQLPLQFNDGRAVPEGWLADAAFELADHFDASSLEPQRIEGLWRHGGLLYRDKSVRLVVDLPDTVKNRRWMKGFKSRWKERLEQIELWMISYRIELE